MNTETIAKPARKPAAAKFKVLDHEITRGSQSLQLVELLEFKNEKLRLNIKSDAFKMQSYALVSIYHPTERKWNHLAEIHFGTMKTEEGLIYMPQVQRVRNVPNANLEIMSSYFDADRKALLDLVKKIL